MCLAIVKPKGVEISRKYLENGFYNNEDGAGFAISENNEIKLFKGYFTFKSFWEAFRPYRNKTAIIHFRWATHGKTNWANCHPFTMLDKKYAMVHNGVLSIEQSIDKDRSDTWHFVDQVLAPVLRKLPMTHPALTYLIEEAIGTGNKIAVLRHDGKYAIYNEKQGEWHKGAWYSNTGYKTRSMRCRSVYQGRGTWRDEEEQDMINYYTGGRTYGGCGLKSSSILDKLRDDETQRKIDNLKGGKTGNVISGADYYAKTGKKPKHMKCVNGVFRVIDGDDEIIIDPDHPQSFPDYEPSKNQDVTKDLTEEEQQELQDALVSEIEADLKAHRASLQS